MTEGALRQVGKSGQISLGKERSGQVFREELRPDGSILLTPVEIVPKDHWTLRDRDKIAQALQWAAQNKAQATGVAGLAQLIAKAQQPSAPAPKKSGKPRGRQR